MKRLFACMALVGLFTAAWSPGFAGTPIGGLAVALSPDGKTLVAGGDNRALLVMDAGKMEVQRRVWLGASIVNLQFCKDGSKLLAEDTDGTQHLVDTKSWEVGKNEKKAGLLSAAQEADLAAALDPDYSGNVVKLLGMSDLAVKGKVTLAKEQKVAAFGLDAKGAQLAVLLESVQDAAEPKESKVPADLKGLAADEFRLKNDGKVSTLLVFSVPDGKKVREHKLFYSPSITGCRILWQGDKTVVVNYSNLNAVIGTGGEVELFQLENSFNYGIGFSPDQKVLMTGGLSDGTYTKLEGMAKTKFQADKLPSWPEYFKSFAVGADGTAYGATSAYRVAKINANGSFDKAFPVY